MSLDPHTIQALKSAGLLTDKYEEYIKIGRVFKVEYSKTGSKMQAYTNAGAACGKSEMQVRRIVSVVKDLV